MSRIDSIFLILILLVINNTLSHYIIQKENCKDFYGDDKGQRFKIRAALAIRLVISLILLTMLYFVFNFFMG